MAKIEKRGGVYIADTATIVGDVTIGENSSVWFGAVVRGDEAYIEIGKNVNVQDGVVIHPQPGVPVIIGDDVTIGHNAVVHGKSIGNGCLIGMGSVILDGVEIGDGCIIGAGAVVPERKVVPPGSVVRGVPGRIGRRTTEEEKLYALKNAQEYIKLAEGYVKGEFDRNGES